MSSILGTVLANIPWGQVVESAPKIAQGAGRLWETVRKRGGGPVPDAAPEQAPPEAPSDLQQLQMQAQVLAAQVQSLEDEMRATAQVVKDLAEQNAMLVGRMQALQRQARWALGVGAVALAGTALAFWLR
jgi:hypothetical protein